MPISLIPITAAQRNEALAAEARRIAKRAGEGSQALEARARRIAKKAGYIASKSRWRHGSIDNCGGFTIIDPLRNWIVAAPRFEFNAQDVIRFCEGE